jgi:hypothetical protein
MELWALSVKGRRAKNALCVGRMRGATGFVANPIVPSAEIIQKVATNRCARYSTVNGHCLMREISRWRSLSGRPLAKRAALWTPN